MSIEKIELYYIIAISFTIVTSMAIMSFIASNSIVFNRKSKTRFIITFILIALASILDVCSLCLHQSGNSKLISLSYFVNFCYFALAPLIPLLLARIINTNKKYAYIPFCIYGIYFVTLIFLVAFKQVFVISPNCEYSRNPNGFYFFVASYCVSIIYLLTIVIRLSRKLVAQNPYLLFVLFFILLAGSAAQVLIADIYFQFLLIAVTTIIFYDYVSSLFAQIDGLTGLFNQYAFIRAIKNVKEGEAIVVMDADDFKHINDLHGHLVGDQVLKNIARNLQNIFGKYGKCFRYGGDEFVVIVKADADVKTLIDDFKNVMIEKAKDDKVYANVSVGYEIFNKGDLIKEIEDAADKNMYLDKARNKSTKIEE